MDRERQGLVAGVSAYLLWGLFPLYWPLLEPATAVEILAHRIVWSLLVVVALLVIIKGHAWPRGLDRRKVKLLAIAAVLVTINWATYIYGVNSEQVVETSLGYFINPLVTVALGVLVLKERLNRSQRVAVVVAGVAVLVLALDYGRLPWIALTLAFAWGFYGLVKKRADVDALESLSVETALLVLPSLGYIAFLQSAGDGTFTSEGAGHVLLLLGAGLTTAIPLLLFGAAAVRIPLVTLGLLQYLAPVLQFLIGVLIYGEEMPATRLAGFALVWVALSIFAADAARSARARAVAAAECIDVEPLSGEPVLESPLHARVERVQPVERERLG